MKKTSLPITPPLTRPSLILQLKSSQDEQAWWEFAAIYESFLTRLIQRRGVPQAHLPDVTNQVMAAIARSIKTWQNDQRDASFRRWISRVAQNVVIRYMAHERRQTLAMGGTDALEMLAQHPDDPDPILANQYEHELIIWAAERVRDEFIETSWLAFWQTMIEGRSVVEVAQSLAITPGSIYMSRGRIMKRIRDQIDEVIGS